MNYIHRVLNSSIKIHLIGFMLSIVLTLIPFWMVTSCSISKEFILWVILLTSITQIIVHLICFLNIKINFKKNWNLLAFIFTMIIITILLVGSVWIMSNLEANLSIN